MSIYDNSKAIESIIKRLDEKDAHIKNLQERLFEVELALKWDNEAKEELRIKLKVMNNATG